MRTTAVTYLLGFALLLPAAAQKASSPDSDMVHPEKTQAQPAQKTEPAQASQSQSNDAEEPDEPVQPPPSPAHLNGRAGTDLAWQTLEAAIQNKKPQIRIGALTALGTLSNSPKAANMIRGAFKDNERDVRVAAVSAAGSYKGKVLIPTLRQALDDPAAEVSFAAAVVLWKQKDPSGENVLYSVLAGEKKAGPGFIQGGMHTANKDLHDPGTLATIGAEQGAYALMGPFGIGLDVWKMMRKNNGTSARLLAANLIAEKHTPQACQALQVAASDKDAFLRATAARGLGSCHGKETPTTLLSMFGDPKPSVRLMAAASYIRSGPSGSLHGRPKAAKPAPGR